MQDDNTKNNSTDKNISDSSASAMQEKIEAAKAKNETVPDASSQTSSAPAESSMQSSNAASAALQKTNTMAILALVFAFLLPLVGFILALVALSKIKKSNEGGKGLALAGLVLSIVFMIAQIVGAILFFAGLLSFSAKVDKTYTPSTSTNTTTNSSSSSTGTSNNSYSADENKAISTVNSFLQYIKSENYQAAWNLLGPELQKEYAAGEPEFAKEVTDANLRLISTWNITNATTSEAGDRITLDGTATFRTSNPTGTIKFGFYKDNDGTLKMYLWDIRPS
jgi:hypothetical protein